MRLFLIASSVCLAVAGDLKFTSIAGTQASIRWDGTTLTVPQHCRADTCESIKTAASGADERSAENKIEIADHATKIETLRMFATSQANENVELRKLITGMSKTMGDLRTELNSLKTETAKDVADLETEYVTEAASSPLSRSLAANPTPPPPHPPSTTSRSLDADAANLATLTTAYQKADDHLNVAISAVSKMQGPKGDKGDKGQKGDKGDKGDTGEKGVAATTTTVSLASHGGACAGLPRAPPRLRHRAACSPPPPPSPLRRPRRTPRYARPPASTCRTTAAPTAAGTATAATAASPRTRGICSLAKWSCSATPVATTWTWC